MVDERDHHRVVLEGRGRLTVSGVAEVVRFEDSEAVLRTSLGMLTVQGQELKLRCLSLEGGEVSVEGTVTALFYEEPREPGWLRRVFGG